MKKTASLLGLAMFVSLHSANTNALNNPQDMFNITADDKTPLSPVIDLKRAIRGPQDAPVTIVEYSDFQCGYCSRVALIFKKLEEKYPGKIRLLYKHLPLAMHDQALPAAQWYEAIALNYNSQKAYVFHDQLFNRPTTQKLNLEFFRQTARSLGLDVAKLEAQLSSPAVNARINADKAEAASFGFRGTPQSIINGVAVRGAAPQEKFEAVINEILMQNN
jgi:protein-disulfide isomerase